MLLVKAKKNGRTACAIACFFLNSLNLKKAGVNILTKVEIWNARFVESRQG